MANIKIERINHAVQEELMNILFKEAKDELLKNVTITDCEVSSDLGYCKVYVTVLKDDKKEETLKALKEAKGFIRKELMNRVELRYVPELQFVYDDSIEYADEQKSVMIETTSRQMIFDWAKDNGIILKRYKEDGYLAVFNERIYRKQVEVH